MYSYKLFHFLADHYFHRYHHSIANHLKDWLFPLFQDRCHLQIRHQHLLHRLAVGAMHHEIQVVRPARGAGTAVSQGDARLDGQGAFERMVGMVTID